MSNKYDKILGEYRQNDFAIGTSIFGGIANSVLYTDSSGLLASDALFQFLPTGPANALVLGSLSSSKTQSAFARSGSGALTGTAGFTTGPSGGTITCTSGDSGGPITYSAMLQTDIGYGYNRLFLSDDLNLKDTTYALDRITFGDGLSGVAPFYIFDNGVETLRFEAGNRILAGSHAFGSGDFDVFSYGNDSGAIFSGTPFRCFWDDTNGYLTWDDGSGSLTYMKTNLLGEYLTSTVSLTANQVAIQNVVAMPMSGVATIPMITQGASAASHVSATFTYAAAQTFTVTIASPGVLTTAGAHGLTADHLVKLTTTGALPTGLGTTTLYYVRNPSGSTLELSLTAGGASINTSGTQSGTHTITPLCKVTATSHGRAANDPIVFAGGTPLPTGLTAGTQYYVGAGGLTTNEFYPKIATSGSVTQYIAITSSGSGSPYVYGQNADLHQWKNSAGNILAYLDKYGNFYGNQLTTPWRIGHIPLDSNYSGIWFAAGAASPSASNYAFLGDASNTFLNGPTWVFLRTANTNRWSITAGTTTLYDAENLAFGTTTGSKIGTATTQKFAFWNATPIVQPTTSVAAATFVANAGTAVNDASTFDGYTMKQVVKALRNEGLLA